MSEVPKTVWVTKYALTSGVYEAAALSTTGQFVSVKHPSGLGTMALLSGEHCPTREAALARAEEMRAAKIASLKRQIERLEALTF